MCVCVTLPKKVVKKAPGVRTDWLPVLQYHRVRERSGGGVEDPQSCFQLGCRRKQNQSHKEPKEIKSTQYSISPSVAALSSVLSRWLVMEPRALKHSPPLTLQSMDSRIPRASLTCPQRSRWCSSSTGPRCPPVRAPVAGGEKKKEKFNLKQ